MVDLNSEISQQILRGFKMPFHFLMVASTLVSGASFNKSTHIFKYAPVPPVFTVIQLLVVKFEENRIFYLLIVAPVAGERV